LAPAPWRFFFAQNWVGRPGVGSQELALNWWSTFLSRPMDLYGVFQKKSNDFGYLFFLISWETKTVKTKLVVEGTKKLVLLATKVGYPGVFYDGSRFK
jgi:hypothetical protein